jgi:hypothetical protein
VLGKTTEVFSAASGNETVAKFTGQAVPAAVTLGTGARAKIRTGTGSGGFRVEGFVDVRAVPAFTTRNVPVVPDHVWIGGGRTVRLGGAPSGQLTVEMNAGAPIDQVVRATTTCDAASLDVPSFRQPAVPGNARGYLVKKVPLELAAEPGGSAVFTFQSSTARDALLFWSTEQRGNQVRVQLIGDLVVDAWAPSTSFEALKQGEMMDSLAPGVTSISTPKLMMQGTPKVVRVTSDVTIRNHANDSALVIGAVEAGGEVIVLETVLSWSNVVPTSLAIMPPDGGGGFWVKTGELGNNPGAPPAK